MNIETLLTAVTEIATSSVEDQTSAALPDFTGMVNLGKPGEALKETRKVLQQRVDEGTAALVAEMESLEQQIEDEESIVRAANVDAAKAIKEGTETRESLATKRANASVSAELIMDLEDRLNVAKQQHQKERKRLLDRGSRLISWARSMQQATAAFQIDWIQGRDKLQLEKYRRQMNQLVAFTKYAHELLDDHDPELAEQLVEEVTTRYVPASLEEILMTQMPEEDRAKYENKEGDAA